MSGSSHFESAVERAIREAMERGEFDDLPGKGKPVPGAGRPDDAYWWVRSWLGRMRQIDDLDTARADLERRLGALWTLPDEEAVVAAIDDINASLPEGLEKVRRQETLITWRSMAAARRPPSGRRRRPS